MTVFEFLNASIYRRLLFPVFVTGWFMVAVSCSITAAEIDKEKLDFFESKVRPVLIQHCYECHSKESGEASGKLRLDSRNAWMSGGTRGQAIMPGKPDQSLVFRAVNYHESDMQMPPDGKIPDAQIADLKKWIEMGADDPRVEESASPAAQPDTPEQRQAKVDSHWAYQTLIPEKLPPVPTTKNNAFHDPIDAFIFRKLDEKGLQPNKTANRRTLVRRLYYDLLGVPPTLAEINQVEKDTSTNWYESLVDRLLDSPQFGERMARRWMDVARYADNKGYVFQEEREYPHAYRYRDWLIKSFNGDMPYNDFVRYQLIGDRLDPNNEKGNLDAMGMLTLGRRFLNNKNDVIDDRIDVVTRGLLGVTAACARCHDHKFDPVSQADYYSMHGAFNGSKEPGGDPSPMRLVDEENQPATHVFLRGNQGSLGPKIDRKFLVFLKEPVARPMSTGSGRLEMADSIVDPANPLTARVYVNRIWGWIMGVPIVDTPSDFGLRCDPPVQKDVLDTLATDFISQGWSSKKLIRRIVCSSTYRQTSSNRTEAAKVDPENRLWWRAQRKRMDFESYRDAMLVAAGLLDTTALGPSVQVFKAPFPKRRTVYAYIDRQNLPQIFRSFDFASPDAHVPQRSQTTVPQQGLVLLNSDIIYDIVQPIALKAENLAKNSDDKESSATTESTSIGPKQKAIALLYRNILARNPTPDELTKSEQFIDQCDTSLPPIGENAWSYGWGVLHRESKSLTKFLKFPKFNENKWAGNSGPPDEKIGWAMITADGGHPGKKNDFCSVRRWTANTDGKVTIRGKLSHKAEQGDGVEAFILKRSKASKKSHLLGSWTVHHGESETAGNDTQVKVGDVIDFVVDCRENENSDSYQWIVDVNYIGENYRFNSKKDFTGSQPTSSTPWQQLAQALLLTNEFIFVD